MLQRITDFELYPCLADALLVSLLDHLSLSVPLPPVVSRGVFVVGEDVAPGTYVGTDVDDCFWETLDDAGGTIDSDFIAAAPRIEVVVGEDAHGLNNDRELLLLESWTPPPSTASSPLDEPASSES